MDSTADERLQWQVDWRTTVFTVAFLPLFASLGFWQLGRAEEKREIAHRFEERRSLAPTSLEELRGSADGLAYRRVVVQGEFLQGRDFLLDNRIVQGRYGFEVISPLRLAGSGQLVLVNRGWIAGDSSRRVVPQIPSPEGEVKLEGTIYVPPGKPYTLGESIMSSGAADTNWPRLVLALEVTEMAAMLKQLVYPYTVRVRAGETGALTVDWPLLNISPAKHVGYAVQWFSMMVALLLMYLWRSSNIGAWARGRRERKR
jgi:surfeit locus 1 family protein